MKRAVTNRHKPCPTPDRVQQQDNVSPVANYEVHLNTVIRQVNVSASRGRHYRPFRNQIFDESQMIHPEIMLNSLPFSNHRDHLGRRKAVCSTEMNTEEVLVLAIHRIRTMEHLRQYELT